MINVIATRLTAISIALAAAGCAGTMAGNKTDALTGAAPSVGLASTPTHAPTESEFPPNATAGQCYTRLYIPPVYKTEEQTLLKRAAAEKVDIIPAKYEEVDERVLVKPASKRIEVVPAVFETVEEQVMIKPAGNRIEEVPATYETVTEQVLVSAAYTTWKRGAAPQSLATKVDEDTGEILCLVEVPAVYKTVSKEVVKTPLTTREVDVPAEYTTVTRQVMKTPSVTREVEVPAEYGTIKVTKLVSPAKEKKSEIPAEYQTVERQLLVSEAQQEWRQILCETNSTPQKISQIQSALLAAGFKPGRTDGVVTNETFVAINDYQKAKNLPVDPGRYINIATVESLGVVRK